MGGCMSKGNAAPIHPVDIEPLTKVDDNNNVASAASVDTDKNFSNDTIGSLSTTLKELAKGITHEEGLYLHFTSKQGLAGICDKGPRVSPEGQAGGGFYVCKYEEKEGLDALFGPGKEFDHTTLAAVKVALYGRKNADKRKLEDIECLIVFKMPLAAVSLVEMDVKDERHGGVALHHVSVSVALNVMNLKPDVDKFIYLTPFKERIIKKYQIFDQDVVKVSKSAVSGVRCSDEVGWSNSGAKQNNAVLEEAKENENVRKQKAMMFLRDAGFLGTSSMVDEVDGTKHTRLMQAARAGEAEVVRNCLMAGADPVLKHSESGSTALHLAASRGHQGIVATLLPKARESTDDGWMDNGFSMFDALYMGTSVLHLDGWNFLHVAARRGHAGVIRESAMLLKQLNSTSVLEKLLMARDLQERTCLHCAVSESDEATSRSVVDALVEAYGEKGFKEALLIKDCTKQTPAELAKVWGRSAAYLKKLKPK